MLKSSAFQPNYILSDNSLQLSVFRLRRCWVLAPESCSAALRRERENLSVACRDWLSSNQRPNRSEAFRSGRPDREAEGPVSASSETVGRLTPSRPDACATPPRACRRSSGCSTTARPRAPRGPRSWCSCERPKRSALSITMIDAFGTSTPTSITDVATMICADAAS